MTPTPIPRRWDRQTRCPPTASRSRSGIAPRLRCRPVLASWSACRPDPPCPRRRPTIPRSASRSPGPPSASPPCPRGRRTHHTGCASPVESCWQELPGGDTDTDPKALGSADEMSIDASRSRSGIAPRLRCRPVLASWSACRPDPPCPRRRPTIPRTASRSPGPPSASPPCPRGRRTHHTGCTSPVKAAGRSCRAVTPTPIPRRWDRPTRCPPTFQVAFRNSPRLRCRPCSSSSACTPAHVPAQAPDQPNADLASGVAVRVMTEPPLNGAVQAMPQSIPAGAPELTPPVPVPDLVTVRSRQTPTRSPRRTH